MNTNTIIGGELNIDSFRVSHTHFDHPYYNNSSGGYVFTSFGYIVSGSVEIITLNRSVRLGSGTLFLVPQGLKYCSAWAGTPDVEFFSVHTTMKKFMISGEKYQFQTIPAFSNEKTEMLFREIFSLYERGEAADKIRGLGLYCLFFADVLPHLEPVRAAAINPALADALDYIERNYRANFSMNELADHCMISVSHLFHLFSKNIGRTPVAYRNECRIRRAAALLRDTKKTVEEIAGETGFNSAIYFREVFRSVTGMTPIEYRTVSAGELMSDIML